MKVIILITDITIISTKIIINKNNVNKNQYTLHIATITLWIQMPHNPGDLGAGIL